MHIDRIICAITNFPADSSLPASIRQSGSGRRGDRSANHAETRIKLPGDIMSDDFISSPAPLGGNPLAPVAQAGLAAFRVGIVTDRIQDNNHKFFHFGYPRRHGIEDRLHRFKWDIHIRPLVSMR
jgi:hypothetical protein